MKAGIALLVFGTLLGAASIWLMTIGYVVTGVLCLIVAAVNSGMIAKTLIEEL